jgi:hypothetical protein
MIKSMGIELEGAWNEIPLTFFKSDINGHKIYRGDGSVSIKKSTCVNCGSNLETCNCDNTIVTYEDPEKQDSWKYVGELASPVFYHVNNLVAFIDKYHPDHTNFTCGGHIHVKPETILEYKEMMTKKFYHDFMDAVEYWARSRDINPDSELWKRLRGKSLEKGRTNYCKLGFLPHRNGKDQDRYRAINYCYDKHKTIEFRIFPCFQSKQLMKDCVKFVYDFCNVWLLCNRVKKYNDIKIELGV